jgi:hypothetical protein
MGVMREVYIGNVLWRMESTSSRDNNRCSLRTLQKSRRSGEKVLKVFHFKRSSIMRDAISYFIEGQTESLLDISSSLR